MRIKRIMGLGILLVFILFPNQLFSQKNLNAIRVPLPLVIDGKIDSLLRYLPDSAIDFTQMEPDIGQPSSERTVAYLMYDTRFIYFAVFCYQYPSDIVAKITARDNLSNDDDAITIILDTYD